LVLYNKRMQPLGCATITKDDSSRAVAKFPSGNIVGKVEFSGDDNSTSVCLARSPHTEICSGSALSCM
jgi:hypothetical protein